MDIDKSWIEQSIGTQSYVNGVTQFIEFARRGSKDGLILCPCVKCKLGRKKVFPINVVQQHLLHKGFFKEYKNWIFHGPKGLSENLSSQQTKSNEGVANDKERVTHQDDIGGMLKDAFGVNIPPIMNESTNETPLNESEQDHDLFDDDPQSFTPQDDAKYKKLLDASNEELYPGCTTFSKLSFLLHLFHLKCMFNWSSKSLTKLFELLIDAFPQITSFISTYYDAQKLIKELGLGYETIDACPNDCMLYWGENSRKTQCNVCHTPRWKTKKGKEDSHVLGEVGRPCQKGTPAKVMRYFPLIPRLKRMYMSSQIAEDMRWHDKGRVKDGILRHPADALAWKEFDAKYYEFASDPRSVRIGLVSDGFNPYRLMNTNYSTLPVVLIIYNLPPWLCMKPSSFILSLIIPGKSSPGNNIDVYLQPLLQDLKLIWDGVDAFDAYDGEHFKLRGALTWTINDFPAYAMLSGWSTKGYYTCPSCTESTHSFRCGSKICYGGHRKWLPKDHHFRFQGSFFDGNEEHGSTPTPVSGSEILKMQEGINYKYGKTSKPSKKRGRKQASASTSEDPMDNNASEVLWTKRSIFFDLPYWEHNRLRHNLDVMHIEKNVCDNVLGTLLNIEGKCKDDEAARKFLESKGLRPHLWLQPLPNGGFFMPHAPYYMGSQDKERFLSVLAKLKVPDGYASNISRCVNLKQRKLLNLKSHDNHILMQEILPVALQASQTTQVIDVLSDLCSFFKALCSKTLDVKKLDELQSLIVVTLCRLEKEFLPPFFTIMIHLLVHLVEEAKLSGPVHYRWMYPIERYLARLKAYVRNKAHPEGSIAKGYILEETITFCSRYLENIETVFNKPKRNDDNGSNKSIYLFNSSGRRIGGVKPVILDEKSLAQAQRYVLLHSEGNMKDFHEEFLSKKQQECHSQGIIVSQNLEIKWMVEEFPEWIRSQVPKIDARSKEGKLKRALARGLNPHAVRLNGYILNGHKFHTTDRERKRKTQNSGVMVEAEGDTYYGKLIDIYELDYYGTCKVVVFRCNWVDITSPRGLKYDNYGHPCVNFSKLMHTGRFLKDDPFIFSSQAKQVFYVEDEIEKGWLRVVRNKPRDSYDLGDNTQVVLDDIY